MRLTYTDSNHRYYVDGTQTKSVSAVAKITADDYKLQLHKQRSVAIGMTMRPDLIERVAVDIDNKDALDLIVEDAHQAAKANDAANRGQQRHRVLELSLLGRTDRFITDQQRRDGEVLARTIERYGLEPMPDRVEQFVIWPQVPICGRYDCILGYQGAPSMMDLKSGRSAVDYPHATVTQLAMYAYAPRTSKAIEQRGDKWTCDDWTTMPDGLDLETGYVILVGDDDDVGTLYALDLRHGLRAANAAMELVTWRREHNYGRNLARKIEATDRALVAQLEESTRAARKVKAARKTSRQLAAVVHATDPPRPEAPAPPDEGAPVEVSDFTALEEAYHALAPEASAWFKGLVRQAIAAGVDFRAQQRKTARRYEIYRGLITLASHGYIRDEVAVGIVEAATGDDAVRFANVTAGHALGSLNAAEAATFAKLADEYVS